MNTAFLILGSNIGNRLGYINKSIDTIASGLGQIINKSAVYESEPWGFDDEINFLNQIIIINTDLLPHDLLKQIHIIESALGRKRKSGGYSSRTIDIDILFYNNEYIKDGDLIIPHPRLHERKFTLEPLYEIAPNLVHPVFKKTVKNLLSECQDKSDVKIFL